MINSTKKLIKQYGLATAAIGLLLIFAGCGEPISEETPKENQEEKENTTKVEKQPVKKEALPEKETPGRLDAETQKKIDAITKSLGENFRGIKEIESPELKKYLPGYRLYQIDVNNPNEPEYGPKLFYYSLVATPEKEFLSDYENLPGTSALNVTEFINRNVKVDVIDKTAAIEITRLYAQVNHWTIMEQGNPHNMPAPMYLDTTDGLRQVTFYCRMCPSNAPLDLHYRTLKQEIIFPKNRYLIETPSIFLESSNILIEPQTIDDVVNRYGKDFPGLEFIRQIGKNFHRIISIRNGLFQKYMPGHKLYLIMEFNPGSYIAGRAYFPHSLIISPTGKPTFLKYERLIKASGSIVDYINTNIKIAEINEQTAFDLARFYATLRPREFLYSAITRDKHGKSEFITDEKGNKKMFFYIMGDGAKYSVNKCEMTFGPGNKINVTEESYFSRGGYR